MAYLCYNFVTNYLKTNMKNTIKVGIGATLAVALIGGAVYFANSETLQGRIFAPGVGRADHSGDNENQSPPDACPNLVGQQNSAPMGFMMNGALCVVDRNQSGHLTVQLDPHWTSNPIQQGFRGAAFTRLQFSTTGTLPVKVTKLTVIATHGSQNVDSVQLMDAESHVNITGLIPMDRSGHVVLGDGVAPLFSVIPGTAKNIDIIADVKSTATIDSQIALGIYVNTGAGSDGTSPLDFMARAGYDVEPWISYDERMVEFSNGRLVLICANAISELCEPLLQFHDTVANSAGAFRIIAGAPKTVIAPQAITAPAPKQKTPPTTLTTQPAKQNWKTPAAPAANGFKKW